MNSRARSAIVCAVLLTVSILGMRYGRDENYLPYEDYEKGAKEVFYSCDNALEAGALSFYSANNIINRAEKEHELVPNESNIGGTQVLPPVITPPNGVEVFDETGS